MTKTIAARILDQMKITYELREYEWNEEELDAVTVARKVGLPPEQVFKTLVVRGDKTGVLVACIPGDGELDLKALAGASGNKKVEMVPVKEIQGLTGYIRGGVSPLGMKKSYGFLSIPQMALPSGFVDKKISGVLKGFFPSSEYRRYEEEWTR